MPRPSNSSVGLESAQALGSKVAAYRLRVDRLAVKTLRRLSSIANTQGIRPSADQDARTLSEPYLTDLAGLTLEQARERFPQEAPRTEAIPESDAEPER